jgi:hypothetical protein
VEALIYDGRIEFFHADERVREAVFGCGLPAGVGGAVARRSGGRVGGRERERHKPAGDENSQMASVYLRGSVSRSTKDMTVALGASRLSSYSSDVSLLGQNLLSLT